MDSEIIRRWNERVKPHDTVIHLGDFGFLRGDRNQEYYLSQLNGNLVLVAGNHDGNNSVHTITQSIVVKHGGIDWWCQHHPSYLYTRNMCGHVHNKWRVERRFDRVCVNVGIDVWDYRPVSIEEIIREVNLSMGNKPQNV